MAIRITGRIVGLRVDRRVTFISLDNEPAQGPKDNVWLLANDDPNYNAQYSLALAAASNRWPVTMRIAGDGQIGPDQEGFFKTIGVAWAPLEFHD